MYARLYLLNFRAIAERELKKGLIAYDRRHGWRGALGQMVLGDDVSWAEKLTEAKYKLGMAKWKVAVVLEISDEQALIGLKDGSEGTLPLAHVKWARKWVKKRTSRFKN